EDRGVGLAEDALELGPSLGQRTIAQIAPPVAEEIEGDERDASGGARGTGYRTGTRPGTRPPSPAGRLCRNQSPDVAGQMNPALQLLKTGGLACSVEGDDLAVEDDRLLQPARPFLERGDDFRKLACFLVAQPRP